MLSKVSSLIKTVKKIEDVSNRGTKSLENTIDAIEAVLAEYGDTNKALDTNITSEELIGSTKVSTYKILCRYVHTTCVHSHACIHCVHVMVKKNKNVSVAYYSY